MPFWQLFYHIVWATRYRAPILTPDIEPLIYNLLQAKAISLGGHVYALNGAYDHVHLIAAVPPKIALANFIGQIKAVASTKYNQAHLYAPPFFWQKGIFHLFLCEEPASISCPLCGKAKRAACGRQHHPSLGDGPLFMAAGFIRRRFVARTFMSGRARTNSWPPAPKDQSSPFVSV